MVSTSYRDAIATAARRRRRIWIPVGLAAAGVIAILAGLPDAVRWRGPGTPRQQADRALLLEILGEVKRAWKPEASVEAIERARAVQERIEPALQWLLAQPSHALLPQALRVAGELRVQSVRDEVLALRNIAGVRTQALVCADKIEAFPPEELQALLDSSDDDVTLAGVAIAASREPRPEAVLAALLRHDVGEVRRAAFDALPAELGAELAPVLMDIALERQPEVAIPALRALGRTPHSPATEGFLVDQMLGGDAAVVAAAVAALGEDRRQLAPSTVARLWQMIDMTNSRDVVARAFLCLEHTGAYDAREVEPRLAAADAFGRYFVARLLVAEGNDKGIEALLDLFRELQDSEQDRELSFAVRTLLGTLANKTGIASEGELRDWFAEHPLAGPRPLPPPQGL